MLKESQENLTKIKQRSEKLSELWTNTEHEKLNLETLIMRCYTNLWFVWRQQPPKDRLVCTDKYSCSCIGLCTGWIPVEEVGNWRCESNRSSIWQTCGNSMDKSNHRWCGSGRKWCHFECWYQHISLGLARKCCSLPYTGWPLSCGFCIEYKRIRHWWGISRRPNIDKGHLQPYRVSLMRKKDIRKVLFWWIYTHHASHCMMCGISH